MEFHEAVFEFSVVFHLMLDSDCQPRTDENWVVSHGKGFRANIILWISAELRSTLEVRAKLADFGLAI